MKPSKYPQNLQKSLILYLRTGGNYLQFENAQVCKVANINTICLIYKKYITVLCAEFSIRNRINITKIT